MKTDREILQAKHRAMHFVNIPSLQVAIWACRQRKIRKFIGLIRVKMVLDKQKG